MHHGIAPIRIISAMHDSFTFNATASSFFAITKKRIATCHICFTNKIWSLLQLAGPYHKMWNFFLGHDLPMDIFLCPILAFDFKLFDETFLFELLTTFDSSGYVLNFFITPNCYKKVRRPNNRCLRSIVHRVAKPSSSAI